MRRASASDCTFQELSASAGDFAELERFYRSLYIPEFPDPDERESLANMKRYLALKRERFYGKSNYHIVLAKRGDEIVGGSISDYLAKPNTGVIEFLFSAPSQRSRGVGKRLLDETVRVLEHDARSRLGRRLRAVVAEMNDPFVRPATPDNMDPFVRALIWSKWGFGKLEFSYVQPALSRGQDPVTGLLLIVKPVVPAVARSVPSRWLLEVVHEYVRLAMRIPRPEENVQYRGMKRMFARTPRIAVRSLADYAGEPERRFTLQTIARTGIELRAVHALIRRAMHAPSRVAPLPAFAHALRSRDPRVAYHLWALRVEQSRKLAGAASFFSLPSVGFGGYIVLQGPLQKAGLLRPLIARMEQRMQRDRDHARGWFVECGADSAPIFKHIGFAAVPAPYHPPRLSPARGAAQDGLTLLYKRFGAKRSRLPARSELMSGVAEILRHVYKIDAPRTHACYRELAREL